MTASTSKTWAQLEQEIAHTFDLFLGSSSYTLESPFVGARAAIKRKAGRAPQTPEERAVTLRWTFRDLRHGGPPYPVREVVLAMSREETALANLELLAKTVEWLRMAHVRGIDQLAVKLLRQMYPQPPTHATPPPPRQERVHSSGPYAALHVSDDAPLEVAEAAYRALSRAAHPDVGGSHAQMKALNLAIEQIRRQKEKMHA